MPKPQPGKERKGLGINARPKASDEDDFLTRIIGGQDPDHRIKDLDGEGVWAEVIYPSLGIWTFNIRTPEIVRLGAQALNEFALDFQQHSLGAGRQLGDGVAERDVGQRLSALRGHVRPHAGDAARPVRRHRPRTSRRIRVGAFQELFPHVPQPPADGEDA